LADYRVRGQGCQRGARVAPRTRRTCECCEAQAARHAGGLAVGSPRTEPSALDHVPGRVDGARRGVRQPRGEGIDTSTPAGRLQLHILGAIAEFERARIAERVRLGVARAKAQGKRLGRPRRRVSTRRSPPWRICHCAKRPPCSACRSPSFRAGACPESPPPRPKLSPRLYWDAGEGSSASRNIPFWTALKESLEVRSSSARPRLQSRPRSAIAMQADSVCR